jgi:hypothetical protein
VNTSTRSATLSVVFVLSILYSPTDALAVVIDDFEVGSITVARLGATFVEETQTGLDPTHVLGGSRFIQVGRGDSVPQTLTVKADESLMTLETGNTFGYFDLGYGSDSDPLNLNLLAAQLSSFVVDFTSSSTSLPLLGVIVRTATAEEAIGATSTTTLPNGLQRAVVPFDRYPPSVDLGNVEQIVLRMIRFPPNNVLTIHRFLAVPEPSSLLLGLALSLAFVRGRWRYGRGRT